MFHRSIRTSLIGVTLFVPALAFGAPSSDDRSLDQSAKDRTKQGAQRTEDQSPEEAQLNEPQVAGILTAANDSELAVAKLAVTRGSGTQIKDFAQMLVRDHSLVAKRVSEINSQLGQLPQDSTKSTELKASALRDMTALEAAKGLEFDRIFISQQVEVHEKLLLAIDNELLPSVQSDSFRSFLTELRVTVVAHLDMAKKIQADQKNTYY